MSATAIQSCPPIAAMPTIPAGWDAKAEMVDQCIFAGKRLTLWISMLIAEAREDFADPSDWIKACTDRWGWDKAHLHHIHAVGRLLLSPMPGVVHAPLCELEFEKVLAISRLPGNLIGPFLAKARPQDLTRDEVRAAVNRWRVAAGEPTDAAPPARIQLSAHSSRPQDQDQYDFLDLLFAPPAEVGDPQVFHDQVHARAGSVDAGAAQLVAFRSMVCLDALLPHMAATGARDLAIALRNLAAEADIQAAQGK